MIDHDDQDTFDAEFSDEDNDTPTTGSALAIPELPADYRVPQAGEYWRVVKGWPKNQRKSLRRRTVLLVVECRYIDDALHSVVVKAHPLDPQGGSFTMILAEFLAHFRYEPNAELIRANEIASIQREAEHEQQLLARGPTREDLGIDEQTQEVLALPPPVAPSTFTELAKPGVRERMEIVARTQIKVAEAQAAWLSARHEAIQKYAGGLASFYSEQSAAALARVSEFQKHADALAQGVKSLGLYLGEGVEVDHILEGESAPSSVPLALFQAMRFLDEEYAVYRALDGATWRDFDDFAKALATDRALLERVLPTERCVIAMRYRRQSKRFEHEKYGNNINELLGAFMHYLEEEQRNRCGFLLIRDGGNVYRVQSDVVVEEVERLFPTQQEKDEPFKDSRFFHGVDENTITPESTRYYKARTEYDAILLFYRRLMLLMAGLNDRLGIFSQFYDAAEYPSFMSLRLQTERFNYIYDEETLFIGEGRPTFHQWWTNCNAHLTVGSRVLVRNSGLLDAEVTPSAKYAYATKLFSVGIAERGRNGALVVKVPVSKWGREYNATAPLTGKTASKADRSYLVLDVVRLEDLDFYINSRSARPSYMSFLALFIEARKVLKKERSQEAEFRRVAFERIAESCPGGAADTLRAALYESIAAWRSKKHGEPLPKVRDAACEKVLASILTAAKSRIQSGTAVRRQAEAFASASGRAPLRVVRRSDKRLYLYATAVDPEKPFGDAYPHVWVACAQLPAETETATTLDFAPAEMPGASPEEVILAEWPDARNHLVGSDRFSSLDFLKQLWEVRRVTDNAVKGLETAFGAGFDPQATIAQYESYWAEHVLTQGKSKGEMMHGYLDAVVPIGIGLFRNRITGGDVEPHMLCVTEDLFGTILASENGEELIGRMAARIGLSKMPRTHFESVPQLEAVEMRYGWRESKRAEDLDLKNLLRDGCDVAYLFAQSASLSRVEFEEGEERQWGDALADVIEDLGLTQKKGRDQLLYLAPGVKAWLRGRMRPVVAIAATKRKGKRSYMRPLNVTSESTTRSRKRAH